MLEPNCTYHIYNRANGEANLFREDRNYDYFLFKYFHYINPIAETYAYCLMPNHFHAMIRVHSSDAIANLDLEKIPNLISKQFSNLFNSYAKAINKTYKRRGSLFQRPFKYKKVDSDNYFTKLILYIHNNPVKHGFVLDAREWPHSSLQQFIIPNVSSFEKPPRNGCELVWKSKRIRKSPLK